MEACYGYNVLSTALKDCDFKSNDTAMKSDFFDGRYRKMFEPWNLSGGPRQNEPEACGAYEQGM